MFRVGVNDRLDIFGIHGGASDVEQQEEWWRVTGLISGDFMCGSVWNGKRVYLRERGTITPG